jgi:lipopolysaccharide transport system permease protein
MEQPLTIVDANHADKGYWKEVWRYRGLFFYLAWRDVLVRYKQTAVGIAWSVLRPLLYIGAFLLFGLIFGKEDGAIPNALIIAVGVLPWQLFATAFAESAGSVVGNANLLTKVYFPRIIVPASTLIVALIDFAIALGVLVVLLIVFGYVPSGNLIFFPLFMIFGLITAAGSGFLIAALNVKFRDFRYVVPFIVQIGMFVSPVGFDSNAIYGSSSIPDFAKTLYALNPMVGVIDGFRWCVLGDNITMHWDMLMISGGFSIFLLIIGIWYFRRVESTFADII